MVEFYPQPFGQLCERAFLELERNDKIFDLPRRSFYRPDPNLDTGVVFQGKPAGTPLGPASGPQSQLVPNLVLSWLGGSRIIELKTVQVLDELKIPRPCIDATTIGYNVEWSQELKIAQSLREYVAGAMLIEILAEENVLGLDDPQQARALHLDLSLGYDLAGITTPQIRQFLADVRDPGPIIDALRLELPPRLSKYRDYPFATDLLHNITLSTFHGCPADEIESIVRFLLFEEGIHMTIKMNPTLYGRERLEHLLFDVMGYTHLKTNAIAFERDIQWDTAIAMVRGVKADADAKGLRLAVKFSNTLEMRNPGGPFEEEVVYLSGEPLHMITTSLAGAWRAEVPEVPISFAAGVDQRNFADLVSCDFKPVTTCTDLLRPGGYARLPKYMARLEGKMRELGVATIGDFVLARFGHGGPAAEQALGELRAAQSHATRQATIDVWESEVLAAGAAPGGLRAWVAARGEEPTPADWPERDAALEQLLARAIELAGIANTPEVVAATQADPRYGHEKTKKAPRKIDSQLVLFDCITCDKCIPVCPNDANFYYELGPWDIGYVDYRWAEGQLAPAGEGRLQIEQSRQIANFADYCNECGNCDVFCPEHGGPYIKKPSFFSSRTTFEAHPEHEGFVVERKGGVDTILGRLDGRAYRMVLDGARATFDDGQLELSYDLETEQPTGAKAHEGCPEGHLIEMRRFHQLRALLVGILKPDPVHYVNIPVLMAEHD